MGKKKLIELIKMSNSDLNCWLEDVNVKEAKQIFRLALKEQDRDTRHGCAEELSLCESVGFNYEEGCTTITYNEAHAACMNYRDKDLEDL